ncbi:P-loop containing nucleoside triphosphate hydrolase protein [Pelagophyceae sp. CCMP2097]|nr:P-loop containing nucleoside triphosphate hydrolase protein [Pelagophyceae sp. CCMP2097]
MPKKAARPTPRGGFASTGKSEHRLKRAALKRAASKRPKWRADTLHFPEEAQAIVCGLLCELRLAEVPVDSDDAKRLRRYATAPHKVLKELVSRSEADKTGRMPQRESQSIPLPSASIKALGDRVRLMLVPEGTASSKKGKRGAAPKLLVVSRSGDLTKVLSKAAAMLKTKKGCDPQFVYDLDSGLELFDTLTVPDGAKLVVTDRPHGGAAAPDKAPAADEPKEERRRLPLGSSAAGWDGENDRAAIAGARRDAPSPAAPGDDDDDDDDDAKAQSQADVSARSAAYAAALERRITSDKHRSMLAQRLPLPAYQRREEIVALCRARGVVVIAGATGCGKSTQVPQLILDDADSRGLGGVTSVVVTQPRRVAAIALAERVSEERSERSCGAGDVGYTVRLEKRGSAQRTRLEFVTVGVLLRRLQYNDGAALQKVSHIIVDEAHERDLLTDFLLVVLKTRLLRQRASGPPLTVVVMSATLDANLFLDYFAQHGAQALDIPGRLHPVETHFIDAALALVATRPPKDVPRSAREGLTAMAKVNFKTPPSANGPNAPPPAIPEYGVDLALAVSLERQTAAKKAVCVLSPEVDKPLDLAAVSAVVVAISRHRAQQRATGAQGVRGAILVFLPGAAEIDKLCRELRNSLRSDEAWVLPMHSGLTTAEQRRVFQRPPGEQTKIVVSTNISETSVTIDDVTDVVDCGRVREMRHENSASKLAEVWTSKASASQRAGRAGRVRAGTCWRLYPKELHEQAMPAHTAPEILRTPLDNLILQILRLGLGQPHVFLKSALQPPSASAIDASIDDLCAIGAVEREGAASLAVADDDEEEDEAESPYADEEEDEALFSLKQAGFGGLAVDEGGSDDDSDDDELAAAAAPDAPVYRLTALGFHISNLPMDCRIAKLLLCAPLLQRACFITDTRCGSIFDCLEPTLTIAAGLSVSPKAARNILGI